MHTTRPRENGCGGIKRSRKRAIRPARPGRTIKAADTGGGPTWTTGTYDAETDTLFWTTGNPSPDYDGSVRAGANLYTCSVLALDPKTGKRKWYFQFTPHDTHDWDANETPMLVDLPFRGRHAEVADPGESQRVLLCAGPRDRPVPRTARPLLTRLGRRAWMTHGHPIVKPGTDPTPEGVYICPDAQGATNFGGAFLRPENRLLLRGGARGLRRL